MTRGTHYCHVRDLKIRHLENPDEKGFMQEGGERMSAAMRKRRLKARSGRIRFSAIGDVNITRILP